MKTILVVLVVVAVLILIGAIGSMIEGDGESAIQEKSYYRSPPSPQSMDDFRDWERRQEADREPLDGWKGF